MFMKDYKTKYFCNYFQLLNTVQTIDQQCNSQFGPDLFAGFCKNTAYTYNLVCACVAATDS